MQIGHKYDIDWDGLVHATITGVGSAACIYLNTYAAVAMTGITGKGINHFILLNIDALIAIISAIINYAIQLLESQNSYKTFLLNFVTFMYYVFIH